jgi:hypothetical protein
MALDVSARRTVPVRRPRLGWLANAQRMPAASD